MVGINPQGRTSAGLSASGYSDPADDSTKKVARLHKPGVAGSSPAAAILSLTETIDTYHSDKEWLSKSMLWDFLEGPDLFHARHVARTLPPYAGGDAFKKGTLVHQWAEHGEDAWWSRVIQIPEDALGAGGRRTTATDKWEKERLAERPDAILLKPDEILAYRLQFDAIKANPAFDELQQATTMREFSIRWTDELTGAHLKCRPDAATHTCLWDIKTTSEKYPLKTFWKSVVDYGYDIQAALYLEGAWAAGLSVDSFVFLITSTVPNYRCHAVTLPQRLIDKARKRLRVALVELQSRLALDHWLPEDTGSITELYVPERYLED